MEIILIDYNFAISYAAVANREFEDKILVRLSVLPVGLNYGEALDGARRLRSERDYAPTR